MTSVVVHHGSSHWPLHILSLIRYVMTNEWTSFAIRLISDVLKFPWRSHLGVGMLLFFCLMAVFFSFVCNCSLLKVIQSVGTSLGIVDGSFLWSLYLCTVGFLGISIWAPNMMLSTFIRYLLMCLPLMFEMLPHVFHWLSCWPVVIIRWSFDAITNHMESLMDLWLISWKFLVTRCSLPDDGALLGILSN